VETGVKVVVDVEVTVDVNVAVAVAVAVDALVAVGLGLDCSVCAMAAETVPATCVSTCPVSTVRVGSGAEAVGSPGTTQAVIVAKKIRAIKKVFLLFMVIILYFEMLTSSRLNRTKPYDRKHLQDIDIT
jgi:hypothetical protein